MEFAIAGIIIVSMVVMIIIRIHNKIITNYNSIERAWSNILNKQSKIEPYYDQQTEAKFEYNPSFQNR